MKLHHLNCLKLVNPITENVIGHCLLVEEEERLVLIDVGIGLLDTHNPQERIGEKLIRSAGFKFNEAWTAYRQIEQMGLNPEKVTDIILSHLDPDHIGGLADFPNAKLHIGTEEYENFHSGNPRYVSHQLIHTSFIELYGTCQERWLGFEIRKVDTSTLTEFYLVPLFGHTLGHCGIALKQKDKWLFYIGDAYYLRIELGDSTHPVNELATLRADNNMLRIETINKIKLFISQHEHIPVFGYHDITEFEAFNI